MYSVFKFLSCFQKRIIYYFHRVINYIPQIFWIQCKMCQINNKRIKKAKHIYVYIQKDKSSSKYLLGQRGSDFGNFSLFRKLQVWILSKIEERAITMTYLKTEMSKTEQKWAQIWRGVLSLIWKQKNLKIPNYHSNPTKVIKNWHEAGIYKLFSGKDQFKFSRPHGLYRSNSTLPCSTKAVIDSK